SESNPMKDAFSIYATYLSDLYERRERIVRASRDLTMNSKKAIFQVHRIDKHNKQNVLEKAHSDLATVADQHLSRLAKELQGSDIWKLRRAYSPGVQEYVEASTFYNFCINGSLLTLDEMNSMLRPPSIDPSVEPFQINLLDYLLGVADMTGELMRLAIGRISDGEFEFAQEIHRFAHEIYRQFILVAPKMMDDMKTKMDTMLQSVTKIQYACYRVHLRKLEYTRFTGSEDSSFPLFGTGDVE
ncbi:hypothetical protein M569_11720, partial [Genlisea aurea]